MRILHLSDTHVPGGLGPDGDGVDARAALAQLLQDCRHLSGIDLVVVSGDIADDGSPEAYAAVQSLVGGFARERHAGQVYCPGNHDDRAAFAGTLGSGHLDANGGDAGLLGCSSDERAAVSPVSGVRVITLDSLVPGQTSGPAQRQATEMAGRPAGPALTPWVGRGAAPPTDRTRPHRTAGGRAAEPGGVERGPGRLGRAGCAVRTLPRADHRAAGTGAGLDRTGGVLPA